MILKYYMLNLFICLTVIPIFAKGSSIDVNNTKVYGLGLHPDLIVLPVRYFYIEAYDKNNERLSSSAGNVFEVDIEGESDNGICRVWSQIHDRHDGTYIVRYKNYRTCQRLKIKVYANYRHVADSPYEVKGPIYAENCFCPVSSIDEWMNIFECKRNISQINRDLNQFGEIDMTDVLKEMTGRHNHPGSKSFCNYVIKKNEIYRKCYGEHVGFKMFMDNILHSLARKMIIPDTEFIMNLGDWPLSDIKRKPLLPIFSWCGSYESADIVFPTYDLTEATLEMMGRVMLDMISVQSNNRIPWNKKKMKAFWKGRDSRQERLKLIDIARENPNLINASLTNFFFFPEQIEKYGPKTKHESFFKFFDYKYQINIDGSVAAYRMPYLLAGGSTVFKQESPYYEHFYEELTPNVHYVPFKRDLSDLVDKIKWAMENDDEALKISMSSRKYAQESLMPHNVFCYYANLLEKWSKKHGKVVIREGMEHVPNQEFEERFGKCRCHRLRYHEEL